MASAQCGSTSAVMGNAYFVAMFLSTATTLNAQADVSSNGITGAGKSSMPSNMACRALLAIRFPLPDPITPAMSRSRQP